MFLIPLLLQPAMATDLLWLGPVPNDARTIATGVGASSTPRSLIDLRSAKARATAADAQALTDLVAALEQARQYEAQLDGELLILQLLEPAVEQVQLLRNETDASSLFRALTYQGFAADRYFGDALATSEEAEPWRVTLPGLTVERPWLDALAMMPERAATAYEIAEAPQRVTFNELRTAIRDVPPGLVTVPDLPDGSVLIVDGQPKEPGVGGTVTLPAGRHFLHLEMEGEVVERWSVRLMPTEAVAVSSALPEAVLQGFVGALADRQEVPAQVMDHLAALAEPVYLARAKPGGGADVWDPSSGVLAPVGITPATDEVRGLTLTASVGALGGWLSTDDFYFQDIDGQAPTFATVNAVNVGGYGSVGARLGLVQVEAALDLWVPLGEAHVALTGERSVRVRAVPHLAGGLTFAQLTLGLIRPYHPAIGIRGQLPLSERFEARLSGWYGLGLTRSRDIGDAWEGSPLFSITGGIGMRWGRTDR